MVFEELFSKSVNKRMTGDVEPGSFLSGGVDSSLITLNMSKNLNSSFISHNLKFPQKNFDESQYAKSLSDSVVLIYVLTRCQMLSRLL